MTRAQAIHDSVAMACMIGLAAVPAFLVAMLPLLAPLPDAPASFKERWQNIERVTPHIDLGPCSGSCGVPWNYRTWGRGLA